MDQFVVYLMIVIYAFSSIALARDMALARGVIYDQNTFVVQATTDSLLTILNYDCNIFIVQATGLSIITIYNL